jgi:hypothetical protein
MQAEISDFGILLRPGEPGKRDCQGEKDPQV